MLGPISEARIDAIVRRLPLSRGAQVYELACGKAELLVRLLLAHPHAVAAGFDRSPWFLEDARRRALEVGVLGTGDFDRLALVEVDVARMAWPEDELSLMIGIGASGIVGGHAATLTTLGRVVRPAGGLVLFGDGVWVGEPPADGLAAFGMERAELPDGLDGQRALGAAAGLEPLWSELVTVAEWDDYESAYGSRVAAWAARNPVDPDRASFLERVALMRESYAGWRRATFGFGITLFERR